jgi:DNA-binding LytR/AlgR family response regulator
MQKTFYIIDREADSINRIMTLFKEFPEYECMGVSYKYEEAMNAILKGTPRLVFGSADIPLAQYSIFQFIHEMESYKTTGIMPRFVATSYQRDKSYEAIKNGFFDFLLKPLNELEIRKTILKFEKAQSFDPATTLCLKSYKDYRFLNTDEIVYLKADSNATDIHMESGKVVGGYHTLKYFETLLPLHFVRIHHSYIVNMHYVIRMHFGKYRCVLKKTEEDIPFSRTYRDNVEFLKESLVRNALITLK